MTPKQIKQRQTDHANAYRDNMRCLLARVEGMAQHCESLSDEDLIFQMGISPGKPNHQPASSGWITGLMETMQRHRATVRELTYVLAVHLENRAKKKAA